MLGYLTVFDRFVLSMFVILFACIVLHNAFQNKYLAKTTHLPTRILFVKAIESFVRIFFIPTIIALYLILFSSVYPTEAKVFASIACIIIVSLLFYKEKHYFTEKAKGLEVILKNDLEKISMKLLKNPLSLNVFC
jgi:hypothetical protein